MYLHHIICSIHICIFIAAIFVFNIEYVNWMCFIFLCINLQVLRSVQCSV